MIRITYSREKRPLAERIRDDLAHSPPLSGPVLIVLASRESLADGQVQAEIEKARAGRMPIIPLLTEDIDLPADLQDQRPLNFSGGYHRERLLRRLAHAETRSLDLRRANRRALIVIASITIVIFGIALIAIVSGSIAFPVAEYNEEATFQAEWVNGLIRETLENVQPRSTADALNFPATQEAAPTRLYLYIRETATALPKAGSS